MRRWKPGGARLHLTLAEPGTLRLRLHADRDLVVAAGGATLAMRAAMSGVLEVPAGAGAVALAVGVSPPAEVPGLWLTGVSFHPG